MKRTVINEQVLSEKLAAGETIQESMLAAGYAPSVARNGIAGVAPKIVKMLSKDARAMLAMSRQFTLKEKGEIAMGRLVTNCIAGKDGGVMSAKTLGSHRELNLWTAEIQAGVIVIAAPTPLAENKSKILDNEAEE